MFEIRTNNNLGSIPNPIPFSPTPLPSPTSTQPPLPWAMGSCTTAPWLPCRFLAPARHCWSLAPDVVPHRRCLASSPPNVVHRLGPRCATHTGHARPCLTPAVVACPVSPPPLSHFYVPPSPALPLPLSPAHRRAGEDDVKLQHTYLTLVFNMYNFNLKC